MASTPILKFHHYGRRFVQLKKVTSCRKISGSFVTRSQKEENSGPISNPVEIKTNKILESDLSKFELDRIRNFSIIAHIDHGKSTLADCMLEYVGAITKRNNQNDRVLDKLQVERERGITVKAQTASVIYEVSMYHLMLSSVAPHVLIYRCVLSHSNLKLCHFRIWMITKSTC